MNTKTLILSCLLCCSSLSMSGASLLPPMPGPGQDRALFFAVNNYQHMDQLQNPIQNARDIAAELARTYGFEAEVVENPTLDEIDAKLAEYNRNYTIGAFDQSGQLFIFFSGHGLYKRGNGYFMTKNADPTQPQRTALEYDYYRSLIDEIPCQHIMVAIDACHSAAFDPGFSTRSDRRFARPGEREIDRVLSNHENYKSRMFWTSDGVGNETPDRSNFAYQLLEGLRARPPHTGYITSSVLYSQYLERAAPKPGGGRFGSDDPNSCFLFFLEQNSANVGDARADQAAYQAALAANTLNAYRQYLSDYPNGDFRTLVRQRIDELEAEIRELIAWDRAKKLNSRNSYQSFIKEFPESIYLPVAEEYMRALPVIASDNFVLIEGDTFIMGCLAGRDTDCFDAEKPSHEVIISTFYLSKFELTQAQWRQVMGNDPENLHNKGCDDCPVEGVSWNEIQEFLQKLNAKTDLSGSKAGAYRLPTEAEWEYTARGGNKSQGFLFSGSNILAEVAWYGDNAQDRNTYGVQKTTRPVGGKKANELGLYDMNGNVMEWCSNGFGDYPSLIQKDPTGPESSVGRVFRGGDWAHPPLYCRLACRFGWEQSTRGYNVGFRLARSASQ